MHAADRAERGLTGYRSKRAEVSLICSSLVPACAGARDDTPRSERGDCSTRFRSRVVHSRSERAQRARSRISAAPEQPCSAPEQRFGFGLDAREHAERGGRSGDVPIRSIGTPTPTPGHGRCSCGRHP
jgi:hypothetical protein